MAEWISPIVGDKMSELLEITPDTPIEDIKECTIKCIRDYFAAQDERTPEHAPIKAVIRPSGTPADLVAISLLMEALGSDRVIVITTTNSEDYPKSFREMLNQLLVGHMINIDQDASCINLLTRLKQLGLLVDHATFGKAHDWIKTATWTKKWGTLYVSP